MKTLLVIGGTGFFGESFRDAFRRGVLDFYDVKRLILASRSAIPSRENLDSERVLEYIQLDVTKDRTFPNAEYVIHAAATTNAARYLSDGQAEHLNITTGVSNFAEFGGHTYRESSILFTSSGAVYGVPGPRLEDFSENNTLVNFELLAPTKRDYADAKLQAEDEFSKLGKRHGISVSIARCFAFVGRRLPRDQHFAVGNFIKNILSSEPIIVRARHAVVRSYMHADELVHWLMRILQSGNTECPIFNVGSDDAIELHDLAKVLASEFKIPLMMQTVSEPEIDFYVPNIDKAKNKLGLKVEYGSYEAILRTIHEIKTATD